MWPSDKYFICHYSKFYSNHFQFVRLSYAESESVRNYDLRFPLYVVGHITLRAYMVQSFLNTIRIAQPCKGVC